MFENQKWREEAPAGRLPSCRCSAQWGAGNEESGKGIRFELGAATLVPYQDCYFCRVGKSYGDAKNYIERYDLSLSFLPLRITVAAADLRP